MPRFALYIDLDNAAFDDDPADEVARILHMVAERIKTRDPRVDGWHDPRSHLGGYFQTILDLNGNNVGSFGAKNPGQ